MNKSLLILPIMFLTAALCIAQPANHVVISEVAPMGGASTTFNTGEYVELYNPLPTDVTFGANVQIISGNTSGTNAAEWQLSLSGKTIKAYGFFLIGDGAVTTADIAFPASKNLANSGARSCVQLRDGPVVIDAFGWDQVTTPTLTAETKSFKPSGTGSDKKSFERKSGSLATAPDTLGNAWDSNDNSLDFFENAVAAANPQSSTGKIEKHPYQIVTSGSGTASILPTRWKHTTPTTITIIVQSATDTLRALKFVKPGPFSWSPSSIAVQPASITKTQSGDTTTLAGFILRGTDSVVITIAGVTAADTTDEFTFAIASSTDGTTFGPLQAQPKTLVYGTPRPINVVKRKGATGLHTLIGKWAVVRGIVTVANEFSGPTYLQDATAGMAVYDSSVSLHVQRGDDVILLGKVAPYNELFELTPCTILEKIGEGNSFDTLAVTASQIAAQGIAEPYEGRLIRVNNVKSVVSLAGTPATIWTVTGSGTNYKLVFDADTLEIRINPRTNLANLPIPTSAFDVVGPLGQYNNYYQILPRSYQDIIVEGAGPRITSGAPYEKGMTPTTITLTWTTDVPGTSIVKYGKTSAYTDSIVDANKVTDHTVTLNNLTSATIYHVQIGSAHSGGTTFAADYIMSTTSQNSTGMMNVYFNKSVNTAYARGENAQKVSIVTKLINRINAATYSIDAAFYSLSGSVGANIATALIAAKGRGVHVRVIGEKGSQGTAPWTTLKNASIPVIDDGFDATNGGGGLMHNKFVIFDNRDSVSETDDWAWTGSWNATDPGDTADAQNVIEIQDKALANAYTVEFNEMWGSGTDTPNSATTRFGARKLDNTPHYFMINNTPVELYFSPSDRTTSQINKTLNKATTSINIAMLTATRNEIANVLGAKKRNGLKVRMVMDNRTDQSSVYDTLAAMGIDIHLKKNITGFLHHKYCIVDPDLSTQQPILLTGSHNWSGNAEYDNDENTLIISSRRIANLYLQEFGVRYADAGGVDVLLGVNDQTYQTPMTYSLAQNYPNPFNPTTQFGFRIAEREMVKLVVYDILGRETAVLVNEEKPAGSYTVTWDAGTLSSGVYLYTLHAGNFTAVKKLVLMK